MIRIIRLTFIFVLLSGIASVSAEDLKPTQKHKTIAKFFSKIISKNHFQRHELDDEISQKLFEMYLKTLDPGKIYFTQEDINRYKANKLKLDDQLSEGDIDFAFVVYNDFLNRLQQYSDFMNQQFKKGFDFTKDETYTFDRRESKWAANDKELKELWRRKIKNDILTLIIIDKAAKADAEAAKAKNGNSHPSWTLKTPEERVKKRTEQYFNHLKQYEPIKVLELYLSSLARVYDPHSAYMSPRTEEDFNIDMSLSLVGIGAMLSNEDGYTKIVKLIPGGPAERDGTLKPEDRIIAVAQEGSDPVDIIDMPLSKVVTLIRGRKNTKVYLTVLSGSKGINSMPKVVTIVRDKVILKESEAKGEIREVTDANGKKLKIGIITLPSFYIDFAAYYQGNKDFKSSSRDVKKLIEDFNKKGIDGLVLDMRSNGGGSLLEAILLSGLFIKDGPVVQIKSGSGFIDVKPDTDESISYEGPMLVLINKLSASATEIFAGAMKDYNRAILVGDSSTHGKGTVQTIYELKKFLAYLGAQFNAGAVKYTNAKFYRINGESTQLKGIVPDIIFPSFSDYMKIAEGDLDHPLPWDTIKPVDHSNWTANPKNIINILKAQSEERRKTNKDFQRLKKDIEVFNRLRERKSVSLNEKVRWNEYMKEKNIQDEQSEVMGFDEDNKDKSKDIYLDETLQITKDYISILNKKK